MITNYTDLPDPIWTVKIGFNTFLSFNTKTPSLLKNHTDFFLYKSLNQPFSVKINGIFATLNSFIYVVSEIDDKNINLNQNLKEKLQYHHPPLKFLFCRTATGWTKKNWDLKSMYIALRAIKLKQIKF